MGLVTFPSSKQPVLVDASFLVSVYDKRDPHHLQSMATLERVNQRLVTCEPPVTEAIHLLRRLHGAPQALLASIQADQLEIAFQLARAADSVSAIMSKYADTPCDFADACLIALADQFGTGDILTLDSDFKHYRWRRNKRFRMLIPME
ncbi:MAG: PIN domain-containing protein [Terracidiphilus sp.]|jgi:predicted nucleic acid-binding protein